MFLRDRVMERLNYLFNTVSLPGGDSGDSTQHRNTEEEPDLGHQNPNPG